MEVVELVSKSLFLIFSPKGQILPLAGASDVANLVIEIEQKFGCKPQGVRFARL